MKNNIFILIFFVLGLAVFELKISLPSLAKQDFYQRIFVDGNNREYYVFNPKELSNSPTIVALHGGGGNIEKMRQVGFEELARKNNFIVIYPQGLNNHWNDGRQNRQGSNANDVQFISRLIDKLVKQQISDPQRIYIAGMSNGGIMTYRLGCELSSKIRAIAPVSAAMPENLQCNPQRPLPVLAINGTVDPLVPWNGGIVGQNRGEVKPVKESVGFWLKVNGCKKQSVIKINLPERDLQDGTSVIHHISKNCPVELYEIVGGGHAWPGKYVRSRIVQRIVGPQTQELDAAPLIWNFFSRFN